MTETGSGIEAALTIDGVPGPPVTAVDPAALATGLEAQLQSSYAINFLSGLSNDTPPFGVEIWANK